jgi:hypothetical protein
MELDGILFDRTSDLRGSAHHFLKSKLFVDLEYEIQSPKSNFLILAHLN